MILFDVSIVVVCSILALVAAWNFFTNEGVEVKLLLGGCFLFLITMAIRMLAIYHYIRLSIDGHRYEDVALVVLLGVAIMLFLAGVIIVEIDSRKRKKRKTEKTESDK